MRKNKKEDYNLCKGIIEIKEKGRKEGIKVGREKGMKAGRKKGIKEGREEGIKEGIKEGREEGIRAMVQILEPIIKEKEKVLEEIKKIDTYKDVTINDIEKYWI